MRLQTFETGFNLWLSANDTYNWAHKTGAIWPCSQLSGKRLWVQFDRNGLCDFAVNGRSDGDYDCNELNAILCDHLGKLPKDHPCYFVAIGQFV